jgi:hypothetical protein
MGRWVRALSCCTLLALLISTGISLLDAEWRRGVARTLATGELAEELKRPELWGVEYGFIGAHLAAGRGFAGPYPEVDRPTSVMPPLLPAVFGAVFAVAGYQTPWSFVLLQLLRALAVGAGLACLDRCGFELGARAGVRRAMFRVTLAGFVLVFAPRRLFHQIYDEWFLFGAVALALLWAQRIFRRDDVSGRATAGWGVLLGAMALTQPVVAFALGVATLAAAGRGRRLRWGGALALAALVVAPWSIRNAIVFGRPLPVKSTVFFELYYGTLVSPRGIHVEEEVMHAGLHPFFPGRERRRAIALGEAAYFDEKRRLFLRSLAERPELYLTKVAYRAAYATVLFPYSRAHRLFFNPVAPTALKFALYPLPFLGVLLCWPARGERRPVLSFLTVCYVGYVVPYVLIHFWLRYWVQVLPLHVLLAYLGGVELRALRPGRLCVRARGR